MCQVLEQLFVPPQSLEEVVKVAKEKEVIVWLAVTEVSALSQSE